MRKSTEQNLSIFGGNCVDEEIYRAEIVCCAVGIVVMVKSTAQKLCVVRWRMWM